MFFIHISVKETTAGILRPLVFWYAKSFLERHGKASLLHGSFIWKLKEANSYPYRFYKFIWQLAVLCLAHCSEWSRCKTEFLKLTFWHQIKSSKSKFVVKRVKLCYEHSYPRALLEILAETQNTIFPHPPSLRTPAKFPTLTMVQPKKLVRYNQNLNAVWFPRPTAKRQPKLAAWRSVQL